MSSAAAADRVLRTPNGAQRRDRYREHAPEPTQYPRVPAEYSRCPCAGCERGRADMGRRRRCGAYASQIPVAHVRCRGMSKPGAGPACLIHCAIRPRCSGRAPNGSTWRRWCGGGGGVGVGVGARGDDPRGRGRGGGQGRSAEPRCRTFPPSRRAACRMSHVACRMLADASTAKGDRWTAARSDSVRSPQPSRGLNALPSLCCLALLRCRAGLTPSRSIPAQPRPVRSERRRHARARRPPCPALPCPALPCPSLPFRPTCH
jgi:hypothetical protein